MKKLYGWLSLVQYFSSDQRVLFLCTLRVHSEYALDCSSCDVFNEVLLSNKFFTRNQIKICGHVAKYLCKFYLKVWIWCDMTKGLSVLAWVHSRRKWIKWNCRKAVVIGYVFKHLWISFLFFFLTERTLSKQR